MSEPYVWPQYILDKVDAALKAGGPMQFIDQAATTVLNILGEEVRELLGRIDNIREEACICGMDYGSDCQCEAGYLASEALRLWQGNLCTCCGGHHEVWECPDNLQDAIEETKREQPRSSDSRRVGRINLDHDPQRRLR